MSKPLPIVITARSKAGRKLGTQHFQTLETLIDAANEFAMPWDFVAALLHGDGRAEQSDAWATEAECARQIRHDGWVSDVVELGLQARSWIINHDPVVARSPAAFSIVVWRLTERGIDLPAGHAFVRPAIERLGQGTPQPLTVSELLAVENVWLADMSRAFERQNTYSGLRGTYRLIDQQAWRMQTFLRWAAEPDAAFEESLLALARDHYDGDLEAVVHDIVGAQEPARRRRHRPPAPLHAQGGTR